MEGVVITQQWIDKFNKAIQDIDRKEIEVIKEKARNEGIKETINKLKNFLLRKYQKC